MLKSGGGVGGVKKRINSWFVSMDKIRPGKARNGGEEKSDTSFKKIGCVGNQYISLGARLLPKWQKSGGKKNRER